MDQKRNADWSEIRCLGINLIMQHSWLPYPNPLLVPKSLQGELATDKTTSGFQNFQIKILNADSTRKS